MISVTATNNNDMRTFSGYGATTIDVGAPGENVYTAGGGRFRLSCGVGFDEATLALYDLQGRCHHLQRLPSGATERDIILPAPGVWVLQVGGAHPQRLKATWSGE